MARRIFKKFYEKGCLCLLEEKGLQNVSAQTMLNNTKLFYIYNTHA
jgi:hypothetical protein